MEPREKRIKIDKIIDKCGICWEEESEHIVTFCCKKYSCLNCEIKNFNTFQNNNKCLKCLEIRDFDNNVEFLKLHYPIKLGEFLNKHGSELKIQCQVCKKIRDRPSISELNNTSIPCLTKGCLEMCFFCGDRYSNQHNCLNMNTDSFESSNSSKSSESSSIKNCPSCNSGIEKTIGCDHMICGYCELEFCWICMGSYDTPHHTNPCGMKFSEKTTSNQYSNAFISDSSKFILQNDSWKFLVNGITLISNIYIKFIFGKEITTDQLMNVFGNRFSSSTFIKRKEISLTAIITCLGCFLSLFFRHCLIFYMKFIYNQKLELRTEKSSRKYLEKLNNIIFDRDLDIILNSEHGLTISIIQFIKSTKKSILKTKDIAKWLKLNMIEKIKNYDKKSNYYPFLWKYFSDFIIENEYRKTHNIIITDKPMPLPPLLPVDINQNIYKMFYQEDNQEEFCQDIKDEIKKY